MIELEVKMFGAFREWAPSGVLTVKVTPEMTLEQFRRCFIESLKQKEPSFQEETLVFESAFATDDTILTDTDIVSSYQTLAVLPPVCGG